MMWLVVLILTLIVCNTILPDYLPVDGTLDFLTTLIPLIVGFSGIWVVLSLFKGSSGD